MFYVIGERINGMFEDVKKALVDRDPKPVQELAVLQEKHGASILDINCGPIAKEEKVAAMQWLIEVTQEASKLPLAIDTPSYKVMSESLPKVKNPIVINSSQADPEKLEKYIKLAMEYNAQLILLTMDQGERK